MPRAKKTEQEAEAMRERILDATLALLPKEGPEGVSTRKIAERMGISHTLLYSYFENHAAIIQALRERGLQQMEVFCAESLRRGERGDALAQVQALLKQFIQIARERPMIYQLAWRRDPSMQADPRLVTRSLEVLSQLITLCIERGQCVERDPALAAVMVFSIVNGTLALHYNLSAISQTDRAELETEMIAAAITYLTQQATRVG
ncbi:MAG: TetR/AcrR family transcriptional regulator [Anaerolineae bacterium]|nr:TetR/AcrR family transcriptional regulator [Anaerolineae bacterium]